MDKLDDEDSHKATASKYSRKKLEKMRRNYHLSRSLQPDYQDAQSNPTPFRAIEQYYKRRLWEPDYNLGFGHHSIPPPPPTTPSTSTSCVQIEWSTPNRAQNIQAHIHTLPPSTDQLIKPCQSCHPRTSQRICTFPKQYPGLIYLPSYLCPHQQVDLVEDCLTNGLRKPNVTNVDTHWQVPHEPGMYDLYRTWLNEHTDEPDPDTESSRFILKPRKTSTDAPEATQKPLSSSQEAANTTKTTTRRQKVEFEPINSENYLVSRNDRPKEDPAGSKRVEPMHIRDIWMNGKLRWCTIGWQYHVC